MEVTRINPESMAKPRGYAHAVSVKGDHATIYIGGQNAVDERGNLVGRGSLWEQTEQALVNMEKILKEAGGELEDIVKMDIHIVQGRDPREGFGAFQKMWGAGREPPAITVTFVAGLGNPEWLVEIDAIAVTPR